MDSLLHSKTLWACVGTVAAGSLLIFSWRRRFTPFVQTKQSIRGRAMLKGRCKMVFVVNRARLTKSRAALIDAVSRACMENYRRSKYEGEDMLNDWLRHGQMKVVVKANSDEEMIELEQKAKSFCNLIATMHSSNDEQQQRHPLVLSLFGDGDCVDDPLYTMDSRSFVEALSDIRALRSSVISVLPDLLKRLELIDTKLEIGLEQVSQPGTVDGSTQTELTDIPTQQNAIHIDSLLNDIPSISSNSIHFTHNNFVESFSNEQLQTSSRPKKKRKAPLSEEEHFSRRPQPQRKEAAAAITASCEIVTESQQKLAWNDHVKTEPVACYSVEDDDDEMELHQQQHTSFQQAAEHQQPGSSSVNGELQLNIGDGFSEIIDFNTALVELPPDAPGYFMEQQQQGDEFAVENYGNSPGIGSLIHRTLTEERTAFTCLLCSRDFNQRANCVRHIHTVHANARPYQCDECDKSYKHMHHLSRHKLASHGEAMGQCPVEEPKIHGEGEVMGSSEV